MKFRSDKQRMAVMARLHEGAGKVRRAFGATAADRRQLLKRALIGTAVTGAAAGTLALARRRGAPSWVKLAAMRSALLGAGGTVASAYTTMRENVEARRQKLARTANTAHTRAMATARNLPVEALAAKAVDGVFRMGESALHGAATHHVGELERIAGAKLGGLQSYLTVQTASRARGIHRRYLPQPSGGDDLKEIQNWTSALRPPNLAELSRQRKLRAGYLEKRVNVNAKALWNELANRGELEELLLTGAVRGKTVGDFSDKRNVDGAELQATVLRLRMMALGIGRA